jgi:hypothetical protein
LQTMLARYNPRTLRHGYNRIDGEDVFFIPNPGLGLWAYRGKLLDRNPGLLTTRARNDDDAYPQS